MIATIIADKEYQTDLFKKLAEQAIFLLSDKGFEICRINVGRNDLAFCMGCFGCWIKKPGECVINDMMTKINSEYIKSDVVIYLSPIVFGQFSANIKNCVDRWIPNVLPFFIVRSDGSSIHPARYEAYPKQIIIGYADNISIEDAQLFSDITLKHRRNADIFICSGSDGDITKKLGSVSLEKVGGFI